MNLLHDIKSRRWLYAKGLLFFLLGLIAAALVICESPHARTITLLLISIWAFCRFYYFLFYVLEHYAGREKKYAGLWDALLHLCFKRK